MGIVVRTLFGTIGIVAGVGRPDILAGNLIDKQTHVRRRYDLAVRFFGHVKSVQGQLFFGNVLYQWPGRRFRLRRQAGCHRHMPGPVR